MGFQTLTRHELYDRVWAEPMVRLAKTYGLSDVGLAKLCKKHDIPRPPRGYWAKKQFGQKPKKTPLPNPNENGEIVLSDPPQEKPLSPELKAAIVAEESPEARIEVAASLRGAHKLVSAANEELTGANKNDAGILVVPQEATLDLRVSKAQLRRALLVMDALLKALEERGYTVAAGPSVRIFDQDVSFGIVEKCETVREQPEEHDLSGRYRFGHSRFKKSQVPSGRLVLHIPDGQYYWSNGCRKTWGDAKKTKIEDRLNEFVAGLVAMAAKKREHEIAEQREREKQAEDERRRAEEARHRAERRSLQKKEQERLDELLRQVGSWRKSQDIRGFVEAVSEKLAQNKCMIKPDSEIDQWLMWVIEQADRLDPLKESPPSILDEEIPDEPPRYSW